MQIVSKLRHLCALAYVSSVRRLPGRLPLEACKESHNCGTAALDANLPWCQHQSSCHSCVLLAHAPQRSDEDHHSRGSKAQHSIALQGTSGVWYKNIYSISELSCMLKKNLSYFSLHWKFGPWNDNALDAVEWNRVVCVVAKRGESSSNNSAWKRTRCSVLALWRRTRRFFFGAAQRCRRQTSLKCCSYNMIVWDSEPTSKSREALASRVPGKMKSRRHSDWSTCRAFILCSKRIHKWQDHLSFEQDAAWIYSLGQSLAVCQDMFWLQRLDLDLHPRFWFFGFSVARLIQKHFLFLLQRILLTVLLFAISACSALQKRSRGWLVRKYVCMLSYWIKATDCNAVVSGPTLKHRHRLHMIFRSSCRSHRLQTIERHVRAVVETTSSFPPSFCAFISSLMHCIILLINSSFGPWWCILDVPSPLVWRDDPLNVSLYCMVLV